MKRVLPTIVENQKIKVVRFTQLVKDSGTPEVVTLWTDPGKDKKFMDFVKQNRIATIVQKPASGKKDFGMVGYHPQEFATFLLFPRRLKAEDTTSIIGIKYNLLEQAPQKQKFEPKIVKREKPKVEKPKELSFTVRIRRSLAQELSFDVMAKTTRDGKAKALAAVSEEETPIGTKRIDDKIIEIKQKD